ncbi:thioesterase superfamily protein [Heterostelium album PN500]|uniref:Thioesterase superfamily protein n=1 Tax=Heterostelium pallidum (strain ATCC 26659 / Pp 5 / PN500) TaxID=670386 RepID=D3AVS5_HETP5|nr:thioesterase superfamily protein [Heterostelium album PN500]EFA86398.1 thioesterase superfamily protein [Heterostelium album PN500]|eukprot:XP_020438503.1 thioesterase superfamily protein [Heterostelium album PN500]
MTETNQQKEEVLIKTLDHWRTLNGFDSNMLRYLKLESIDHEKHRVIMTMTVPDELCNPLSTLHGGAMATIVDIVSSIAIISTDPSHLPPNVSIDMSISYAATAPVGESITIESILYQRAENKAYVYTDTTIYNAQKKVCCKGSHTVFISRANIIVYYE